MIVATFSTIRNWTSQDEEYTRSRIILLGCTETSRVRVATRPQAYIAPKTIC